MRLPLFLLLSLFLTAANANKAELPITRTSDGIGNEFSLKGSPSRFDPDRGPWPQPNSFSEVTVYREGKLVSKTSANIGASGFRVSSASGKPEKTKHLLLVDGSFIFGDGLSDNQTIAHFLNERSKTYEAYPIAFSGFGPQQSWLYFADKELPKRIKERSGKVLLFTHVHDIKRLFGSPQILTFASNFPFIKEKSPGKFQLAGRFDRNGSFWQKALVRYCLPVAFCRSLMSNYPDSLTDEQYAFAARVFEEIAANYREQFDVEDFQIIWNDQEIFRENLARHTKLPVIQARRFGHSEHPTADDTKKFADQLFDLGLVK